MNYLHFRQYTSTPCMLQWIVLCLLVRLRRCWAEKAVIVREKEEFIYPTESQELTANSHFGQTMRNGKNIVGVSRANQARESTGQIRR